ncbi:MAG TPA: MmgE/PrpD family protein [Gammaproteobacteria bacterium]|nr:MmgE/PrpD family protein [Gammaproteobacteria bacterium]
MRASESITAALSAYISGAAQRELTPEVSEKTKHHVLDTLAAVVSGSRLPPAEPVLRYVGSLGGTGEALVCGTSVVTTAINASMANAMLAHADETDDSHLTSRSHLGCGVVPAALAMGEREGSSGENLVRAVALGYDIGARVCHALGTDQLYAAGHSTHTFAPTFGAAAAAGALAGLSAQQCRWLLSYTAQQTSGVNCWQRDRDHIEKAFDFGGMAGRNGVTAATMVQAGFTGVDDVLSGPRNFLIAFSPEPRPERFIEGLGERYEIMHTNIKKWSVGSPVQAVLDSVQALVVQPGLGAGDVDAVVIRMSDRESHVVDGSGMSNVNVQHLAALMIVDGTVSFASAHDPSRLEDPTVQAVRARIELRPDPDLPRRHPLVILKTRDGNTLEHATHAVRGTPENPMSRDEVEHKARELIAPVLGGERSDALIAAVWDLEKIANVSELRRWLSA